jgi:hypothetical protein
LVGEALTPAVVRLGASQSVGGPGRVIKHLRQLSFVLISKDGVLSGVLFRQPGNSVRGCTKLCFFTIFF